MVGNEGKLESSLGDLGIISLGMRKEFPSQYNVKLLAQISIMKRISMRNRFFSKLNIQTMNYFYFVLTNLPLIYWS